MLLAACTKSGGRGRLTLPVATSPEGILGLTAEEENFREGEALDLDGSEHPFVALRRSSAALDQIEVLWRTDFGWTGSTVVSDDSSVTETKSEPFLRMTTSTGVVHIFWEEFGVDAGVHYAAVDGSNPPSVITADTLLSTAVPSNVPGGTVGSVTAGSLKVTVDRSTDDVFAAWAQLVTAAGAGAADECVVAGAIVGGIPPFGESFAVLDPNLDASTATSGTIALGAWAGRLHVLWIGTTASGAATGVRHRTRTDVATYSPIDVVSDVTGEESTLPRLVLVGDGDAYAAWVQSAALPARRIEGAYRPAGDASTFAPSGVLAADPGADPDEVVGLEAVVDANETPHLFYKRASGGFLSAFHQSFSADPAAGWGAVSGAEVAFGPIDYAGASAGDVAGHVDDSGNAVLVFDYPAFPGASIFDVYGAIRPPGNAFTTVTNLTGYGVDTRLDGMAPFAGGAFIVFRVGDTGTPRELYGTSYTGTFSTVADLSGTYLTDTHGNGEPGRSMIRGGDDGRVHILYREHTGGTTHDLFYRQM